MGALILAAVDAPTILISAGALAVSAYSVRLAARRAPNENRRTSAEASMAELNLVDEFRTELETTRREMSGLRDRLLDAERDRARAQAELATELARASRERHDLKDEIHQREGRIARLQRRVEELEQTVATLRAQLDEDTHGRRHGDQNQS